MPSCYQILQILDLAVLELDDDSALATDEVVVVRGQVAFIAARSLPEIELFRVPEPFEKLQRAVHRYRSDPRCAFPDGMGELLDRYVIPCAEKSLDHDSPAPAPLASGGQDLAVDPFEETFQLGGRLPLMMMKFIFIIPSPPASVKTIRR